MGPRFELSMTHAVIQAIRDLNWSKVPAIQRTFPEHAGGYNPVFSSGDWVRWYHFAWEAVVPSEWWASEESEEYHLTFLGAQFLGSLMDLPQEGKPDRIR